MSLSEQRLRKIERHGRSTNSAEIMVLAQEIHALTAERDQLRQRAEAAEALNKKVICSYCGRVDDRTGDWEKDKIAMADHILKCENHPFRKLVVLETRLVALERMRKAAEKLCHWHRVFDEEIQRRFQPTAWPGIVVEPLEEALDACPKEVCHGSDTRPDQYGSVNEEENSGV